MRLTSVSKLAFVLLAFAVAAKADTVGNSLTNTATIDGCYTCEYVVGQPFAAAGETVTSYTFFSAAAFNGQGFGDITPVLFSGVDNGNGTTTFTETGVGTTQFLSDFGVDTFAFGLTAGSAVTGTNTFFGFFDMNGSVVTYTYALPTPNGGTYLIPADPGLGDSVTILNGDSTGGFYATDSQDNQNDRLYALTATAATPEPSSLVLLGTGLAGFGAAVRRRFKK